MRCLVGHLGSTLLLFQRKVQEQWAEWPVRGLRNTLESALFPPRSSSGVSKVPSIHQGCVQGGSVEVRGGSPLSSHLQIILNALLSTRTLAHL